WCCRRADTPTYNRSSTCSTAQASARTRSDGPLKTTLCTAMDDTTRTLQAALPEYFAPWVQALGLVVENHDEGCVTLRLPQSDQLSRVGGMLCGQAMMAAADTAMV